MYIISVENKPITMASTAPSFLAMILLRSLLKHTFVNIIRDLVTTSSLADMFLMASIDIFIAPF